MGFVKRVEGGFGDINTEMEWNGMEEGPREDLKRRSVNCW